MSLLILFAASAARAQTDNFYEYGRYHWSVPLPTPHGFVDASNGNLHIEIPIASIPERGHIPYTASLVYDSHIWRSSTVWQPTNVGGSWGGWRLIASNGPGQLEYSTTQLKCRYFDGEIWGWEYYTTYSGFSWQAPDGHTISWNGFTNTGNDCKEANPSVNASDLQQWGYHLNVTNYTHATIYAADGTQIYPAVEDTNGNQVNTLGGTPLSVSTNGNATTYTIPNSANSSYQVVVTAESIPVDTAFGQSGVTEYSGDITVIQSITLPDGSTYQFTYDQGSTAGHYGVLMGMTLPTGGQVSYSHSVFQDLKNERNLFIESCTWDGGTWTYTPAVSGGYQTVTVTKPNNSGSSDTEVHTFTYVASPVYAYLDTMQKYYSGSSTLLKTVQESYSGDLPQSITTSLPMPGVGSVASQTQFTYDTNGFGNVIQEEQWGYYTSGPPSSPYRTIQYGYLANSDNNMVDKQTSVIVTAGGPTGAVMGKTIINYDQYGSGLTSVTGAFGHDDTNFGTGYTARGNPTEIDRYLGSSSFLKTTMTYDTTGQVLSVTDSDNNSTAFSYADRYYSDNGNPPSPYTPSQLTNAFVTAITPPLNGATALGYYYGSGKVATTDDQNGVSSYFHYDGWNRPTTSYLPAGGWSLNNYTSSTEVDAYKGITTATPSTGCSGCTEVENLFDPMARPLESILEKDPDGPTTSELTFGSDGRVQMADYPFRSGSTGSDSYSYDGLGRVTQVKHADGSTATIYYGPQVTAPGGNATQTCSTSVYGIGFPILQGDEAGLQKEIWQDAFGRAIEVDSPDPANSNKLDIASCYGYDYLDNLNGLNQNGQGRAYGHDFLSRITSTNTPESGITYFYYTTSSGALCSGDPTEVCRRVDAKNVTTTYAYDKLNRLTGISYSDGTTPSVSYSYDGTSCPVSGVSNYGVGHRTGMADGSGSTAWCYDQAGRIVAEQQTIAGITKTTQYAYNLDGSLTSITYPSGHVISYSVGNAGRAVSATDTSDNINYAAAASYAPQGAIASIIYGKVSGGFNGTNEQRGYNNRMELNSVTASSTAGTAENLAFNYALPGGNNGTISSITNNANTNLSESFSYDAMSRILSAATQSNSASGCWGLTFGSGSVPDDQWSNLTQMTVTQCSAGSLSIGVNSSTNQVNTTGYSYDADGNTTGDASYTYTYDAEGRITSANAVTYAYDGNGLRVEKSSGKLYWRDIFGNAIAETDATGSTTNANYHEYIFFGGRRIAQRDGLGNVNYFYADELGSTLTLTDGSGNPCYETTYTPYGEEHATMTNCSPNYKFASYEYDSETGLYYAMARYYNPRLGRFMTPDPLMGDIRNPQTLNRYAYVANNPTNLIDPLGLDDEGPPVAQCDVDGEIFYGDACDFFYEDSTDGNPGGGPANGGGIKAALAKLLKNPNCASLLGGLDKAEKILNQANLVDVSVPGFQPPNEVAKQISSDINNSNTIAEVSYQGNPCQGAIQCFFSPWSGTQFNVYYGAVYNDNSFSGEETLLMHEFMHVATQGTWAESVVDYVPQNQSWPVSIANIEKNCGTAEPVVPSKGGAE